ncbi:MAG: hypothetical protein ACLQU4_19980 [Limisphaerales bacterium]
MSELMDRLPNESREVWRAANSFVAWLERHGYASYDPYDIWGTAYGLFSRRMYYRRPALGLALVVPILAMEVLYPRWRKWFVHKERFATADAQLLLAFLNLYQLTDEKVYLEKARDLGKDLLSYSIPGYHGHCWGYPFAWENVAGRWPKNTPYITVTPYCYEAFAALHEVTGDPSYADIMASIARFVFTDLMNTPTSPEGSAASYSPLARDKVVNVSAYRAFVLFDAARRLEMKAYAETARRNLEFVLESQHPDGSWFYEIDGPVKPFIDHFHTCFVLKSLRKINRSVNNQRVEKAIRAGYSYYRRALFTEDDEPKSFSAKPRTQIVKLEMYDVAESVTLGALLRAEIPEALALSHKLALRVCRQYQLPDGHFITRIYRGGRRHTQPFLRWSQAQVFYALTNVLCAQAGNLTRSLWLP